MVEHFKDQLCDQSINHVLFGGFESHLGAFKGRVVSVNMHISLTGGSKLLLGVCVCKQCVWPAMDKRPVLPLA